MGCPPDPMEVDAWRADQEKTRVISLYNELGAQKDKILNVYQRVQLLLMQKNEYLELIKAIEDAIPEKEVVAPEKPSQALDYVTYKFEENSSLLTFESKRLKNRETSLCIIREAVLALAGEIPLERMNEELKKDLNSELDLFIIHREDDRQTWIKWIDGNMRVFEHYLQLAKRKSHKENVAYLQGGIVKLQKEKSRVIGLTTSELLSSRTIFGHNQDEFELDYLKVTD